MSKSFGRRHERVEWNYLIAAHGLKHFHYVCPETCVEVETLIDSTAVAVVAGREGVGEKWDDSSDGLGSLLFHAGNCQEELHDSIVDVFVLEWLQNEDFLPSNTIQNLQVYLPVVKFGADMPPQADVEMADNFLSECLWAKCKYFDRGELRLEGSEEDFVDGGLELIRAQPSIWFFFVFDAALSQYWEHRYSLQQASKYPMHQW